MASEEFKTGDLVWARMKGFPPWPAKVVDAPPNQKAPKCKKAHFVYFFGSQNYAWILDDKIFHHSENAFDNLAKKKSAIYQKAVDELIDESRSLAKDKQFSPKAKKEKSQPQEEKETKGGGKLSSPKTKKEKNQDEECSVSSKPLKKSLGPATKIVTIMPSVPKKKERKVLTRKVTHDTNKKSGQNSSASPTKCSPTKSPKYTSSDDSPPLSSKYSPKNDFQRPSIKRDLPLRISHEPSKEKFGFIGLGYMGDAILVNLLDSGHDVTVWNKSSFKCEKYVAMGAKQVRSPADLIAECDITFCCVSDKDASKALLFGDRGILKGLENSEMNHHPGQKRKGYVEMTSIDPETSITINEAINMKHGVYLEAPFRGSIRQAQRGELLFLASGDRDLFAKCESCFHCFSKYAYYLTCEVGQASKVALLLSHMSDSMCVLVAEALVLGERLGVEKADFLKIIRNRKDDPGIFGYKNLIHIFELMSKMGNEVLVTQKHVHKDIKFALDMADQFSQSMPFTSIVNQVFIRAKLQALNENHSD